MWHDVKQGSGEWHELKKFRLSSSKIHNIVTAKKTWDEKSLLTKTGETYIRKSLRIIDKDDYQSPAMERGILLEPEARFRFECVHGMRVEQTGFYSFEDWLGFSSDGIVHESEDRKGILEIKCPAENMHLLYCTCRNWADIKKVSPLLHWEMCLPLLLLDFKRAWFVSYYPDYLGTNRKHLALFTLCLERDEKLLGDLANSLIRAKVYRDNFIKKLNLKINLWGSIKKKPPTQS